MDTRSFSFFILFICIGIYSVYLNFQIAYSPDSELKVVVHKLNDQLLEEKSQKELALYQLESFKQYVALNLPDAIPEKSFSVRKIASVVSSEGLNLIDLPKHEFNKIKKLYLNQNFEAVNSEAPRFVENYSESVYTLEVLFLLANSFFKTAQYESSLNVIYTLVNQFPESEMTGFSLLLMGEILEKQERWDEAKEIYLSIEKNFPFPEIKSKAQEKRSRLKV